MNAEKKQMNASDIEPQFWKTLQNAILLALKEQKILSETQYSAVKDRLPLLQEKSGINREDGQK